MSLNESVVEDAAISWFAQIGYTVGHGPNLAPGEPGAERGSFADVILTGRLQDAIQRLNPDIPHEAQEEALRKVVRLDTASFIGNNRAFHKMLRDGVEVEYRRPDGSIAGDQVQLVDFARPECNDWFAVNQFTVIEAHHNRRPDLVVFVNGLPLANRFKDSKDPFRIVIVRDMWLTGFDAPCLHTMYADKPMRGHGLMQAIARVNRVFREKPSGLIVDYLGLADQLRDAVGTYTASGGTGTPSYDVAQAIAIMLEKYEVACDILHGFDWGLWKTGSGTQKLSLIPAAQEHVLELEDGKKRFIQVVMELSRAFALCAASDEATAIRDDVSFLQTVQAALNKQTTGGQKSPEDLDAAIRQLVSKAIVAEGQIIDVFTTAGLKKPDISILSDQFLAEVRGLKHRNVAAELLEKLLNDEIKVRSRRNLVQSQLFSDKLKQTLNAYHNPQNHATCILHPTHPRRNPCSKSNAMPATNDSSSKDTPPQTVSSTPAKSSPLSNPMTNSVNASTTAIPTPSSMNPTNHSPMT